MHMPLLHQGYLHAYLIFGRGRIRPLLTAVVTFGFAWR